MDEFEKVEAAIVAYYRPLTATMEVDHQVRHRSLASINAHWPVAEARDILAYLLIEDYAWSTPHVAARLDRDPSSVVNMRKRVFLLLNAFDYETQSILASVREMLARPEEHSYARKFERRREPRTGRDEPAARAAASGPH